MPSWKDNLVPASFRGVPFHWDKTGRKGGRRLAKFEFPDRDDPYIEDLGRRIREFPMTGYVLGDDYMAQRDLLETALDAAGPGTLVHPYRGPLTVVVETWSSAEAQAEGRMARFDIAFVLAAPQPAPRSVVDTAGASNAAQATASAALTASFTASFSLVGGDSDVNEAAGGLVSGLTTAAGSLVGGLANALPAALAAVGGIETAVASDIAAIGGAVQSLEDAALSLVPAALPGLVQAVFAAVATAISDAGAAEALAIALDPSAPYENSSVGYPPPPDPTYGLAGFATYGALLPTTAPGTLDQAQQAANQAAFVALTQGMAVIALAQLYAATNFASADAADAARDQITGLIDTQLLAATDDMLVQAWTGLYAATATDLTTRGKSLPDLISFATVQPMPSLWLANRLYRDAGRAPELVAENAVIHPAFMPTNLEALAS